ncbi:SDR family oxidoreductase [Terrabacter sp. MAHUQ-38]|uniref:SDR family oxidoreductase n=1 Tax=unclassified Terrabacter TaxID=2630222 RepID=UPI00165EB29D|nr:NmrA family NAD(P)-binding protein [Terrabacter sp. MAHUQ-38]MBC9820435.1 NmrA family NAD(P)-binding protein [Terrabacter sp. MAHUQ-38]
MFLVVGATGELGGRVVRLLRADGHDVRCLVRAGSDDAALREVGASVVRGDLTDPPSLRAACEGVETVVATAAAIARILAGARTPTIRETDERGMLALVDAAEDAGVQRFVYLSFPPEHATGTPLERAKLAVEKRLGSSSMRTVILRSDAFQEIHLAAIGRFDLAAGKVSVIGKGDTRRRWIATDDVAALTTAVAVEPDPPAILTFGGPEAMSKNEAIALAGQLTHRRMKVQRMPRPVARLAIRVLTRRNDALASVFGAGLQQDVVEATWDDAPLRERGITPRSASDFLRQQARELG